VDVFSTKVIIVLAGADVDAITIRISDKPFGLYKNTRFCAQMIRDGLVRYAGSHHSKIVVNWPNMTWLYHSRGEIYMHQPRKTNRGKWLVVSIALFALSLVVAACSSTAAPAPTPTTAAMPAQSDSMQMDMSDVPTVPAGKAYAEGQEIRFIHTEVSDPEIAKILSDMMGSPVLVVPALANAPQEMLAKVYVFTNGIMGMGPLGFQPDVFDNPPGTTGYSPLRTIILVSWTDESKARELKSVAEVTDAESKGEITLDQPGVVVNMPFITWPGGQR